MTMAAVHPLMSLVGIRALASRSQPQYRRQWKALLGAFAHLCASMHATRVWARTGQDFGNGSYGFSVDVTRNAAYRLVVELNGRQIVRSPFPLQGFADMPAGAASTLEALLPPGAPMQAGAAQQLFRVHGYDRFGNKIGAADLAYRRSVSRSVPYFNTWFSAELALTAGQSNTGVALQQRVLLGAAVNSSDLTMVDSNDGTYQVSFTGYNTTQASGPFAFSSPSGARPPQSWAAGPGCRTWTATAWWCQAPSAAAFCQLRGLAAGLPSPPAAACCRVW